MTLSFVQLAGFSAWVGAAPTLANSADVLQAQSSTPTAWEVPHAPQSQTTALGHGTYPHLPIFTSTRTWQTVLWNSSSHPDQATEWNVSTASKWSTSVPQSVPVTVESDSADDDERESGSDITVSTRGGRVLASHGTETVQALADETTKVPETTTDPASPFWETPAFLWGFPFLATWLLVGQATRIYRQSFPKRAETTSSRYEEYQRTLLGQIDRIRSAPNTDERQRLVAELVQLIQRQIPIFQADFRAAKIPEERRLALMGYMDTIARMKDVAYFHWDSRKCACIHDVLTGLEREFYEQYDRTSKNMVPVYVFTLYTTALALILSYLVMPLLWGVSPVFHAMFPEHVGTAPFDWEFFEPSAMWERFKGAMIFSALINPFYGGWEGFGVKNRTLIRRVTEPLTRTPAIVRRSVEERSIRTALALIRVERELGELTARHPDRNQAPRRVRRRMSRLRRLDQLLHERFGRVWDPVSAVSVVGIVLGLSGLHRLLKYHWGEAGKALGGMMETSFSGFGMVCRSIINKAPAGTNISWFGKLASALSPAGISRTLQQELVPGAILLVGSADAYSTILQYSRFDIATGIKIRGYMGAVRGALYFALQGLAVYNGSITHNEGILYPAQIALAVALVAVGRLATNDRLVNAIHRMKDDAMGNGRGSRHGGGGDDDQEEFT